MRKAGESLNAKNNKDMKKSGSVLPKWMLT